MSEKASENEIIHRSFYKLDCEQKDKIRKENPGSTVIFKTSDTVIELDENGKAVDWYIDHNDDKITYEERRDWCVTAFQESAGIESNHNILDIFKSSIIERVFITHASDVFCLKTNNGFFIFHACAECCSESWIEHGCNLSALINSKIIDLYSVDGDGNRYVECHFSATMDYYDEIEVSKHKYVKKYRYVLITESGKSCELELRNKSNGYYGGELLLFRINNKETIQKLLNDSIEVTEDF